MIDEQRPKGFVPRFKKKRVAMLFAGVLLAAVIWLVVSHDSTPMPEYQGKTAREWFYGVFPTNMAGTVDAFHEMGSNAAPFLARELARDVSTSDKLYSRIYFKAPMKIRARLRQPVLDYMRWYRAQLLLETVPCKTVIPELMRTLIGGTRVQKSVAASLLERGVSDGDRDCIPELAAYLNSTNETVSLTALHMLGQIKLGTQEIPMLTNYPYATNKTAQFQVAEILNKIDWKVASAYLKERMPDQFSWMKQTNTLKRQAVYGRSTTKELRAATFEPTDVGCYIREKVGGIGQPVSNTP